MSPYGVTRLLGLWDISLQWRHNWSQITSLIIVHSTVYSGAYQRKIKAPRHWPLCGEFTGEFSPQMASNAENGSIWWRHHVRLPYYLLSSMFNLFGPTRSQIKFRYTSFSAALFNISSHPSNASMVVKPWQLNWKYTVQWMRLLPDTQHCELCMRWELPGTFSAPPRVSDRDMLDARAVVFAGITN